MRSLSPRRRRLRRTRLALTLARVRRSAVVTLASAITVAGLTGMLTAQLLADAREARDRWGNLVAVDVVTRPVDAGSIVEAADLRQERRPAQLVPDGAGTGSAVGRTALAPLAPGEVVVAARLGDSLLPAGWRALAVPAPGTGAHPDVRPGDRVEILDAGAADATAPIEGVVVAASSDDGSVTIGVPRESAIYVAQAALAGTAVVAVIAIQDPRRR